MSAIIVNCNLILHVIIYNNMPIEGGNETVSKVYNT